MRRNILRLTRRLFADQPKIQENTNNQAAKLPEFDIFDYAGHKYSYEIKKNYGQYDIQQLWGDRLIFANDKETLKQKRKDTIVMSLIFCVLLSVTFVKFDLDRSMMDASEASLSKMYPNFHK